MGKSKMVVVIPVLVLIAVGVSYLYGWEIGSYFHKDSTANNLEELTMLINAQIEEGRSSANIYVKNVNETELTNINENVVSINGVVSQYAIQEKSRSGMKVYFKYDISDNYYVIGKYLRNEPIPPDKAQAYKLYDFVVQLLDELITDDMTDYEKELAIHDYIVKNCEYGYVEYSKDYAYRAYGCLVQKKAVCNGYAEAMSLLLTCAGVENAIVTGEGREELHAWNQVKLDGNWYNVDATWDDPLPDRKGFAGHAFFNVTDDVMDDDHTWKKDAFNKCDSSDYNYFVINDLVCDYNKAAAKVESIAARDPMATAELVLTDYNKNKYSGFAFVCDNPGIQYFSYSLEDYDTNKIVTLYLNQRE